VISGRGVVISVTLLSLVNKKFVKLKSWLNKSCWQWKGANRKWSWFFDISFGSKVIAKKHKHTNERRSRCPRALCRNLLSRCHVQSISYVKTKSRVKCAFPMSLLIFAHMHACMLPMPCGAKSSGCTDRKMLVRNRGTYTLYYWDRFLKISKMRLL